MRQVVIPKEGPPEVLELREEADPTPKAGELRIRVEAVGLNFSDLLARMGLYPDRPKLPVVMGYEVAGRIDAVGDGVETDWVGRDVLALTRFGGHADVVCCPEFQAFPRPLGMSAEEGAALPVNYLTAYQLLVVMGGVKADDNVLVHSAGGGVGIAALQICKKIGAGVIGTASSGKHEFLRSAGIDHCIDYRKEDFVARTRDLTHGRGVELALDAIGGSSFEKSYACLARTGRLGVYGNSAMATGTQRSFVRMGGALIRTLRTSFKATRLIGSNKGVFGVNLGRLWNESDRVASWMETLLSWYQIGSIRPVIAERFPLERAAEAHHYLHERRNIGKVLLVP
jgi:NADPH:quinone reductase-like Zn-dependent oxidoreductase